MPSIRRSLVGYFLLLLGLALGGVGLLADGFARAAFAAREGAEGRRLAAEYADRRRQAADAFDAGLRRDALELGRRLEDRFQALFAEERQKVQVRLGRAGLAAAHPLGVAAVQAAVQNPRYRSDLFWADLVASQPDEQVRRSFDGDDHLPLFQFHLPDPGGAGRVIRGPRLDRDMPLDLPAARGRGPADPVFDTLALPGVGGVRRVVLRAEVRPFRGRGFGPPPRPPAGPPPGDGLPGVFVACARPLAELQPDLDALAARRDDELAAVAAATREDVRGLRLRLAGIAGATFLALAAGGPLLVRRGLRPVDRLSDAVGRVSERDFRLPVEPAAVGRELLPIHDRLTHTLAALGRAFEREKQAVADISHELRTPVAGLQATLDVALRKPRTPEQYRATLDDCRGIVRQLGHLVERALTLARLDAEAVGKRVPTDLSDLAADCVAVVRPLAEAHGLTVTTDLAPGLSAVTDPDQVREVVMNLLSNAVEYNAPGGAVEVTARVAGGAAVIAVRDTGIGMAPDVADRIFERFFRADPSRHGTGVHAGLGLAIVKEAVARLGGTVAVETAPGRGSTFRVRLPAEVPPAGPPA